MPPFGREARGERRPAGRSGAAGASGRRPLKPPGGRFALRAVSLDAAETGKVRLRTLLTDGPGGYALACGQGKAVCGGWPRLGPTFYRKVCEGREKACQVEGKWV